MNWVTCGLTRWALQGANTWASVTASSGPPSTRIWLTSSKWWTSLLSGSQRCTTSQQLSRVGVMVSRVHVNPFSSLVNLTLTSPDVTNVDEYQRIKGWGEPLKHATLEDALQIARTERCCHNRTLILLLYECSSVFVFQWRFFLMIILLSG